MKRWTVSGDVVFHAVLIGVRGLETRDQQLEKLVDNGIESVNVRNVQTTDGGGDSIRLFGQCLKVGRRRTSEDATHFHGQLSKEESMEEGVGIGIEGLHVAEEARRLSIP